MPYAVVQSQLTPPSLEQLRTAFAETARAGLNVTPADAGPIQRDSYGILLERLSLEHARTAQRALTGVGYASDVVDERQLLDLPPGKGRNRIDPAADALHLTDLMGRVETVAYEQIVLVGAGMVGDVKFVRQRTFDHVRHDLPVPPGYYLDVTETTEHAPRLEMLFAVEPWRVQAGGRRMNYRSLGEEMTNRAEVNFMLLVRRLAGRLPAGVLTRGAAAVAALDRSVAVYPCERAFEEELVWHAWRAMR
jgi:hypothetical protein